MRKDDDVKMARLSNHARRAWQGRSGGFTLIEVLIALALFAIIAIVFAGGLSTASRAVLTADVRTRAESLARTQMESVKNQDYIKAAASPWQASYDKIPATDIPSGYSICSWNGTSVVNCPSTDHIIAIAWDSSANNSSSSETGLQKITLVIKHDDREVTRLEGYKVDR